MNRLPTPVSASSQFAPFLCVPDRFDPFGREWQLIRSNTSGLVMLENPPGPDEIGRYYPEALYDPHLHRKGAMSLRDSFYLFLRSSLMRYRASVVMKGNRKRPDETKVLEVGCSTGDLLRQLHRTERIPEHNLYGIETNPKAAEIAGSRGEFTILRSDLTQTRFTLRFDRIVLWHTLEHLHRIGETLQKAHELLEDNGMLIIALPNLDSFDAARYGREWVAFDAPRHLCHFTPGTLEALLETCGFSLLRLKAYVPDAVYNIWYSEKLGAVLNKRRFGLRSCAGAARSLFSALSAGRDPKKASGMVCYARKSVQVPLTSGEVRPIDFSNSMEAIR